MGRADALILLAFVAFVVAGIWHAVLRAWPMALVCAGLALWVLVAYGPIKLG
jgi:hypothetical protein